MNLWLGNTNSASTQAFLLSLSFAINDFLLRVVDYVNRIGTAYEDTETIIK